jgi:small basic protein (TIGR04137 family)
MSLDRSLRAANSLTRHRNVLKRDERLSRLTAEGKWGTDRGVLGMPKVGNRKLIVGGKADKAEEAAAAATGAAAPAAAPAAAGGKGAPAAKGAAPAAGGKAAAPAAGGKAAPAAKPAGKK